MRLFRHGTKEHSDVQESLIIIDLCNYTLITISLHDGLSNLFQHFRVVLSGFYIRHGAILHTDWTDSVQHDFHLERAGTSAGAVPLFGLW